MDGRQAGGKKRYKTISYPQKQPLKGEGTKGEFEQHISILDVYVRSDTDTPNQKLSVKPITNKQSIETNYTTQ